ncbi:hypothetical protein JCM1840_002030 [Sporobolomyces johnsonii]
MLPVPVACLSASPVDSLSSTPSNCPARPAGNLPSGPGACSTSAFPSTHPSLDLATSLLAPASPVSPLSPASPDGLADGEDDESGVVGGTFRLWPSHHDVKEAKYATSTDSRGYIPVYEYAVRDQTIKVDVETGFVLITSVWKALGKPKADVVKLIESQPTIAPLVRKIRGGILQVQGTWLPFEIARKLSRRVAWEIRHDLVPIFGPSFPSTCLAPGTPGFGDLVLSDPSTSRRRRTRDPTRRAAAKAAAAAAQNNSSVSTAQQAEASKGGAMDALLAVSLQSIEENSASPSPVASSATSSTSDDEPCWEREPSTGPIRSVRRSSDWQGYSMPLAHRSSRSSHFPSTINVRYPGQPAPTAHTSNQLPRDYFPPASPHYPSHPRHPAYDVRSLAPVPRRAPSSQFPATRAAPSKPYYPPSTFLSPYPHARGYLGGADLSRTRSYPPLGYPTTTFTPSQQQLHAYPVPAPTRSTNSATFAATSFTPSFPLPSAPLRRAVSQADFSTTASSFDSRTRHSPQSSASHLTTTPSCTLGRPVITLPGIRTLDLGPRASSMRSTSVSTSGDDGLDRWSLSKLSLASAGTSSAEWSASESSAHVETGEEARIKRIWDADGAASRQA